MPYPGNPQYPGSNPYGAVNPGLFQGSEFGERSLISSLVGQRTSLTAQTPSYNLAYGGVLDQISQNYNNRVTDIFSRARGQGSADRRFLQIPEYLGLRETQQFLGDTATRARGYQGQSRARVTGQGFRLLGA